MPSKNADYCQVEVGLWETEGDFKNGDYQVVNVLFDSCSNEPKTAQPIASDWVEVDLFNDGDSYKK
ncbi:hypothetical protein NHP200010_03130 [Helicobacter bizzozeronii]|uniref:hypothetical protein n=1 Tax=Helicobacter bizzozeronii TaxID=56877 RepID=UPI00244D905B|nr:hypothetical protein [Helicobacter bizzozeronii]GMB92602.1 hypothetical protein NHP200010_03130 [Helicobacter bizzozeronii]